MQSGYVIAPSWRIRTRNFICWKYKVSPLPARLFSLYFLGMFLGDIRPSFPIRAVLLDPKHNFIQLVETRFAMPFATVLSYVDKTAFGEYLDVQ